MVELYRLPLNCTTKRSKLLSDLNYCSRFMDYLVKTLDVTEIGRTAHLIGGASWNGKAPGISIGCVYLESGAQLHTWPETGEFYIDITSCKKFSKPAVISAVENWFDAEVTELCVSLKEDEYKQDLS